VLIPAPVIDHRRVFVQEIVHWHIKQLVINLQVKV
jgi:hypothetical protein